MNCTYQYKQGQVVYTCSQGAGHQHVSGKPLCAKHYVKTNFGTASTKAWKHNKQGQKAT